MKTKEIKIQETSSGELYLQFPDDLLEKLNWCVGDELEFSPHGDGFMIKKNLIGPDDSNLHSERGPLGPAGLSEVRVITHN